VVFFVEGVEVVGLVEGVVVDGFKEGVKVEGEVEGETVGFVEGALVEGLVVGVIVDGLDVGLNVVMEGLVEGLEVGVMEDFLVGEDMGEVVWRTDGFLVGTLCGKGKVCCIIHRKDMDTEFVYHYCNLVLMYHNARKRDLTWTGRVCGRGLVRRPWGRRKGWDSLMKFLSYESFG
jgi:hypothetical protein